jgi:decaprenylphospho-beta-D-ribofuranose 2-oxidase
MAAHAFPSFKQPSLAPAPNAPLTEMSGWGHYPVVKGHERRSEDFERITLGANLSRGMGRAYGDAALPAAENDTVAGSLLADRLLAFDPITGIVRAEAGLKLFQLNHWSLQRGWFTPVTPGTHYVTLGGMVAADVHGKNHHRNGCFGEHVTALKLRVADGRIVECSDDQERDLFRATLGGMGLTGHILEVEFRLQAIPSAWIWAESERFEDLDAMIAALKAAGEEWPYTVCWVDCLNPGPRLGRGVLMKGRWAEAHEAPAKPPAPRPVFALPFMMPNGLLMPWAVKGFNRLYYAVHGARVHRGIQHPHSCFYPLDVVGEWNRLYGQRGFTQYQCVLPLEQSAALPKAFLQRLLTGGGAYLCVMKDCGAEGKGMLSFPKPGISFALDIPNHGAQTQALVDALDAMVIAAGGRVYLAKDAFTRSESFRRMEPRLEGWMRVRRRWDSGGILRSAQSVRLFGDQL